MSTIMFIFHGFSYFFVYFHIHLRITACKYEVDFLILQPVIYFSFCQLQEQNTVPSLRKALRDVAMEKDAAFVAKVHVLGVSVHFLHFLFVQFFLMCVWCISAGGSFNPASCTEETLKRSRRRTI